jgi:four helix bundle protein
MSYEFRKIISPYSLKPLTKKFFMKNFEQLKIWQKGFDIAVNAFKLTAGFPAEQKFGLGLQITKAAVSIPSNIAEGSSRSSKKDYNRFIEISLGSSFELDTQLLIAKAVNFGDNDLTDLLLKQIDEEQKMLMSFMNKIQG